MLPPNPNKRITFQARPTQPRARNMKKRLCYGCGVNGHEITMCPHKSWADKCEAAEQKASNKLANQKKSDGQSASLMSKKLGHPTKKCPMYKEARKEAQVTTRRCYGCNEMGHMIDRCPNKQNKHRANQGRICYACRRKRHLSYDCPDGKIPKPNIFGNDDLLRRATSGTSTSK